jgi:cbb3-type cytochrome oxidase maturation protein
VSVILVLIGASLFVAICFLIAYIWAVRSGQYEDKYTPSVRILFDDEIITENNNSLKNNPMNNTSNKIKELSGEITEQQTKLIENKKQNSEHFLKL